MVGEKILLVLGCILHSHSVLAIWSCSQDTDCSSMVDSVCVSGACICPSGKQAVLGGTACADLAPYYWSPCMDDFQCSRLFTGFQCRRPANSTSQVGNCFCQDGFHYFRGRCWPSSGLGEECTRDEECQGVLRDPFSMTCSGTCECAEGYYFRQRGECRRMGLEVGDRCVIDQDCHFEGGACHLTNLECFDTNAETKATNSTDTDLSEDTRSFSSEAITLYGQTCDAADPCNAPLVCSQYGFCVCPLGYYPNADESLCLAELGSPSTPEQCVGLFTEIRDGVCSCQANFYFDDDMRTCVKAARMITDGCMTDATCHTFGAASRCGPPQQWGLRSCECIPEDAVWDASRSMCRLFAGIGELCEVDSDCLAGELEIQCVKNDQGEGFCNCPEGFVAQDGLCLTLGLELGQTCQITAECTGTPNTICANSVCSCDVGYEPFGDICAPVIGGTCASDSDCVIDNTVCTSFTCQCTTGFVEYDDICWTTSGMGFDAPCNVSAQCAAVMVGSACMDGTCQCADTHHFRDGGCWPRTGLFQSCSRSSECFLEDLIDRVQCRNSLCQCSFDYPYSEELGTCRSSASSIFGSSIVLVTALAYMIFS
ncbi:latent-transforming growth factor beta-binding protein 2 [Ostrinia nubilalis]|uniref:latent-transforming growth factor beta-binding protein 2 n=1 Tax=Ostrinia nubilalis TaxID=29057 RepID=UPI0030822260